MIRLRKSCASPARVFLKHKFKLPIIVAYGNFSGIVWKENICYAVRMKTPLQISPAYCMDGAIVYDGSVSQTGCSIWISILVELCSIQTRCFLSFSDRLERALHAHAEHPS